MASSPGAPLPPALFASTRAERVALARQQFFEEGVRPSGLVGEAVIQSWMRCIRAHADRRRVVAFEPVTPSRLHATLGRNRELLEAARAELASMESSLAGTDCRVLLTDAQGVIVHVTHHPAAAQQPILQQDRAGGRQHRRKRGRHHRAGHRGEHRPGLHGARRRTLLEYLGEMQCAAAPIRDVHGRLAAVLDISVESRRFGFDAASMVALYATTIENRLLQAQSRDCWCCASRPAPRCSARRSKRWPASRPMAAWHGSTRRARG